MAAACSSADAASPMILTFLRLNLFLNLSNHPLLAVKGLVYLFRPSFFWKLSYTLKAFCRNTLPPAGIPFLFTSTTQKFKAFYTFINTLLPFIAVTFAVCGATRTTSTIFFLCSSSLHEWKISSCHTTWQSPHTICFSILIISRIFTFSLMERISRLLLVLEALLASLLLFLGAIITLTF